MSGQEEKASPKLLWEVSLGLLKPLLALCQCDSNARSSEVSPNDITLGGCLGRPMWKVHPELLMPTSGSAANSQVLILRAPLPWAVCKHRYVLNSKEINGHAEDEVLLMPDTTHADFASAEAGLLLRAPLPSQHVPLSLSSISSPPFSPYKEVIQN